MLEYKVQLVLKEKWRNVLLEMAVYLHPTRFYDSLSLPFNPSSLTASKS
jgi:hypothetical protein